MSVPDVKLIDNRDGTFSYPMNYPNRGYFVIFNQEIFEDQKFEKREGSDQDVERLKKTALFLGFREDSIKSYNSRTRAEVEMVLNGFSSADHSNNDCFVCVILTHGCENDILLSKDEKMDLTNFTEKFNADKCKSLAGKPKLFFIQACRGVETVDGQGVSLTIDIGNGNALTSDGATKEESSFSKGKVFEEINIPVVSDFLIAHATIPFHKSWRHVITGSFFIQTLTSVFMKFGDKLEFMEMMTTVNKIIATTLDIYKIIWPTTTGQRYVYVDKEDAMTAFKDKEKKLVKQVPSVTTQLLAKVYFKPKKTASHSHVEPESSNSQSVAELQAEPEQKN